MQRDYSFNTSIIEISAGMEFTFLDFDLHKSGLKGTPYLYTGISLANHEIIILQVQEILLQKILIVGPFGIPMVLGYKTNISNHFILAAEIGARYTFSDELDGSVPDSKDRESLSFGNTNSNDWYVFTGNYLNLHFWKKDLVIVIFK